MTKHNPRKLQDHWLDLEAGGIPLEPMEYRTGIERGGIVIEQEGGSLENTIVELNRRCQAYILSAFVWRVLPGKTIIMNWELEAPWAEDLFEWLPDPEETGGKGAPYSFPGKSCITYPRDIVLNHRIKCVLRRGDTLEGMLLGVGYGPIPEKYRDGVEIRTNVTLFDQWDVGHSKEFVMGLMRDVGSAAANSEKRTRRGFLLRIS